MAATDLVALRGPGDIFDSRAVVQGRSSSAFVAREETLCNLMPRDLALRLINDRGDVRTLEDIEAESIRFALAHYRGQMSQVARKLGIGRSTLYRKMKDLGLAEGEGEGEGLIGDAA